MSERKIMVVDDEPAIGRLLTYQLHEFGYSVCYVQDGLQALERVLLEAPDLILLDVMMPLVSGWDVCRQIRACSSVPIIMLTGKNADADVVMGLEAGADDYITKPFSIAQLRARVEAVLRRTKPSAHPSIQHIERTTFNLERATSNGRATTSFQTLAADHEQAISHGWRSPAAVADAGPAELAERRSTPARPAEAPVRVGQRLRDARQRRGISLYQAERSCRVRWEFLQAIEQENWSYLPRHQLRPALLAYTGYLGIDSREVTLRLPDAVRAPRIPVAAAAALLVLLLVVGLTLL
ncbi:MAG TPA: response regulator [Roseiflexaceae bacterium]|nr:response regulator [Roseiflexaceae bacterium]